MTQRSKRWIESISVVGLLLLFVSRDALAYLDPGTGSFLLQLLIGGLFAGGFAISICWKRVKAFFSDMFSRSGRKDDGHQ